VTSSNTTLLILTFANFQYFAAAAWALPTVPAYGHFTSRFAPNSIPGTPVGDKVKIFAYLDSTDPVGSPTISVKAVQGDTTISLNYTGAQHKIDEGFHLYDKFIDFDPALTGSWEIIPTDSTGIGPSTFGNAIVDPEFLPLVESILVQGTPLGAGVSWTLPSLDGFDADVVVVRLMDAITGGFVFESPELPLQTTSYQPPTGVLEVGVDYVYCILLGDIDTTGIFAENGSWAFSNPFRLTIAGDFNTDGIVDAADYVVWRKDFSGDQAMYDAWRANFGASLGPGSGSVLPSAAPLSASVPEPTALALAALTLAPLAGQCRGRSRRTHGLLPHSNDRMKQH
jgi:hypothetical protein